MAFWALYGKPWYLRKDIPNQIRLFRKYLFDEWFNSLTPEQQEKYKARVIREKEDRQREIDMHFNGFLSLTGMLYEHSNSPMSRSLALSMAKSTVDMRELLR